MQEWIILMLIGAIIVCFILFATPETKQAIPQGRENIIIL